jgi:2,3-diketo-5-methylthio-1-phosphopentane phosphatase
MPALFIAIDFDGTVTTRDTLHVIVEAHGTPGLWAGLQPDLSAGRITVEQAMEREFAGVRASWDEVRALVREHAPVRDGFHDLVAWARRGGHRLLVISNGFRRVIELVLSDAGVDGLEIVSHDASFTEEGCTLLWSERGERCTLCDRRCKRHDLRTRMRPGDRLVYLGDGISDRCAARMADLVFARDGLAEYLDQQGVPYVPFEDFNEVRRVLASGDAIAA